MQSVSITTKFVSSNLAHGEVYSIQHYVIKFVSDLWQVEAFLYVLRFLPPIKLTATIYEITEIHVLLKVALNIITPDPSFLAISSITCIRSYIKLNTRFFGKTIVTKEQTVYT